jgi:hypothetical protein
MKMLLLSFTFLSFNANAFHAITEILPDGQLLICKDYGQVKKGNTVENYVRAEPGSEINTTTVKKDEFTLPPIGSRIGLYHRDFHFMLKSSNTFHEKKLGNAVIVDAQTLVGAERITRSSPNTKFAKMIETKSIISKEDAAEIDTNCVVAVTENNLVVDEKAAVVW